jgi:hypothetical protein
MPRKKQPLTFNLERPPAGAAKAARHEEPKSNPSREPTRMKQVGARIPENLYRELKSHAALKGERVQTILEAMISDYLHQHRGDQNP